MKTPTRTYKTIEVLPSGTISKPDFKIIPITKQIPVQVKKGMKGLKKTSDYIDYDKAMLKGQELLWNDKEMIIGFYIILSVNTGLRVSDVKNIKHSDLARLDAGDYLTIQEQKTKKVRKIQINDKIIEAYKYLSGKLQEQGNFKMDACIFTSQKNTVFATVSLNRILKQHFAGYARNISTHSLRKSFGRRVYELNGESENALIVLSEMFCHSNMAITRRYLGIRQQQIDDIYMSL